MKKVINTSNAPKAVGPYSQAIKVDNFIYTSGALPINPSTGELISDDIKEQTRCCLNNLKNILEVEGYTMNDVVKTTVMIRSMADFGLMNEVYGEFFNEPYPARSAFECSGLAKGAKVEIEAVACK